jgi:hypothetical protein
MAMRIREILGAVRVEGGVIPTTREAYRHLAMGARLRGDEGVMPELRVAMAGVGAEAERLVVMGGSPMRMVWHHWLLQLGERRLGMTVDRGVLAGLWERAFRGQGVAGHIHALTAETLVDGFVYDELCAIHAAYNAARWSGEEGMMERVRRAVRWHVGNTQPDHTTSEPWGLAAFAALDETGTFAEQQLHDAAVQLERGGGGEEMGVIRELLVEAEVLERGGLV